MKSLKRRLIILLVLSTLNVHASNDECELLLDQTINLCQQAILDGDAVIESQAGEISLQKALIMEQQREIAKRSQWYNDPVKSGLTGALIGVILLSTLGK